MAHKKGMDYSDKGYESGKKGGMDGDYGSSKKHKTASGSSKTLPKSYSKK